MPVKLLIAGECYYSGLDRASAERLKQELTLPNPQYESALRFSRMPAYAIEAMPKTIQFHSEPAPGVFCVPRGFRRLSANSVKLSVCKPTAIYPPTVLEPRKWQKDVLDCWLKHKKDPYFDGVVIASPGQGKTVMTLLLAAKLGLKTLVLVHTNQILRAWVDDCRTVFGGKLEPVIIQGSKKTPGPTITLAMIQTLRNMPADLWAREFGLVTVDECHKAPACSYYAAVKSCEAAFRVGLSATPQRTDGLTSLIHWTCGPTRVIAEKDESAVVPLKVTRMLTGVKLHRESGKHREAALTDFPQPTLWLRQMRSKKRIKQIVWLVNFLVTVSKVKGPVLIVTNRVELSADLANKLAHIGCEHFHTGLKPEERIDFLARAKRGEVPITVATTTMLAEGVNVPIWTHLLITQSFTSPILVRQVIGRVERAHPTKTKGFVYHFVDDNHQVKKQFAKCFEVYRKVGADFATLKLSEPDKHGECKLLRPTVRSFAHGG